MILRERTCEPLPFTVRRVNNVHKQMYTGAVCIRARSRSVLIRLKRSQSILFFTFDMALAVQSADEPDEAHSFGDSVEHPN